MSKRAVEIRDMLENGINNTAEYKVLDQYFIKIHVTFIGAYVDLMLTFYHYWNALPRWEFVVQLYSTRTNLYFRVRDLEGF